MTDLLRRMGRRAAAFLSALAVAIVLAGTVAPAFAVQPDEVLKDPALEKRARAISAELRCLVCQNQSIDDSDAPLARDLRILVRQQLKAGKSDAEIMDFVVDRYGEFVLLKPRFEPHNYVLWFATPLLLIAGIVILVIAYRRQNQAAAAPEPLSAAEKRRLSKLLQ